ncbi:MAG: MFS transporter [Hyphomicrobiales bacterium]|nr:MAG: MFS transporter [Hyphomicrobiales bacterium]
MTTRTADAGASLPPGAAIGTPAYRRICLALFLAGFATFSLLYSVQPLLPEFARHFGVGAGASALALSLTTGLLAVSILFAGALSQSVGRRWLMFASMVLAASCNLVAAWAPNWHTLLVARAVEGVVLGGVPAVAMAYLSEEIDARSLGYSMGLYVGGTAFGGMSGRVIMGMLTDAYGWRTALAAISVLGLVVAVGFVLLLPPSRRFVGTTGMGVSQHARIWQDHLRSPSLPLLFLAGCLLVGALVSVFNTIGFRLSGPGFGLGQGEIGLIFTAYLLGMGVSPVAGGLADRHGRAPVLVAGVLLMALGVLLTLSSVLWVVIAGICVLTLGFFGAHAVCSGWVGIVAAHSKGHASSMYLLIYYLGASVLGVAGGWFWELREWPAVVAFCLALLVAALWVALALRASVHGAAAPREAGRP